MLLTASNLLDMKQNELDDLFRASPAGPIPSGEADGTVIIAPDTPIGDLAAKVAHLLFWKGKVFDPEKGVLVNRLLPWDTHAISAKVYLGTSWFDSKEAIILDYSETSVVAHWIRDEIRLVGPGLYLGIVFWDDDKLLDFALQFPVSEQ